MIQDRNIHIRLFYFLLFIDFCLNPFTSLNSCFKSFYLFRVKHSVINTVQYSHAVYIEHLLMYNPYFRRIQNPEFLLNKSATLQLHRISILDCTSSSLPIYRSVAYPIEFVHTMSFSHVGKI